MASCFYSYYSDIDSEHPDVQEKVRRCINQGFIDPEDFKGVCIEIFTTGYSD